MALHLSPAGRDGKQSSFPVPVSPDEESPADSDGKKRSDLIQEAFGGRLWYPLQHGPGGISSVSAARKRFSSPVPQNTKPVDLYWGLERNKVSEELFRIVEQPTPGISTASMAKKWVKNLGASPVAAGIDEMDFSEKEREDEKENEDLREVPANRLQEPEMDAFSEARISEQVLLDDGSVISLNNFLTDKECEYLKEQATQFGLVDIAEDGYDEDVRVCRRTCFFSPELAQSLFDRSNSYLKPIRIHEDGSCDEKGVPTHLRPGLWEPSGLNDCFRAVRYDAGGHFATHHDSGYWTSPDHESIKTFMMYLSSPGVNFSGGPTTLFSDEQRLYSTPVAEHIVHEHLANKGSCFIMNHEICHNGGLVTEGQKWILRTEVMYTRKADDDRSAKDDISE